MGRGNILWSDILRGLSEGSETLWGNDIAGYGIKRGYILRG